MDLLVCDRIKSTLSDSTMRYILNIEHCEKSGWLPLNGLVDALDVYYSTHLDSRVGLVTIRLGLSIRKTPPWPVPSPGEKGGGLAWGQSSHPVKNTPTTETPTRNQDISTSEREGSSLRGFMNRVVKVRVSWKLHGDHPSLNQSNKHRNMEC